MHTYYIILYIYAYILYMNTIIIYICMVLYLTHVDMCIHMSMYVCICIFLTNANHIFVTSTQKLHAAASTVKFSGSRPT